MDAIVVVPSISLDSIVPGATPQLRLAIACELRPVDNSPGAVGTAYVTRAYDSTAGQWRGDILAAVKAWGLSAGTANGYVVTRCVGAMSVDTATP
jgi:hypothetical protein